MEPNNSTMPGTARGPGNGRKFRQIFQIASVFLKTRAQTANMHYAFIANVAIKSGIYGFSRLASSVQPSS